MCKRGLVLLLLVALWLAGPASAGLIGWWTFEDPANLGADSSGKGNNGTVAGDATFSPDASRGSGALLLDGTDDFINVGLGKNNMLADWTSNLTIAAWIKPDDLQRQWNCFFGHTTQNNGVKFELMSGNFRFTTLGVMDYDLAVSLTTGEWSHVAVTFNEPGNLAIFYANGQETGEVRGGSPAAKATGNYNVGYGGYWEPEQFQGLLDDVRIYDKALTAAQISDLYNDIEPSFAKAEKPSPADGATGVTMPLLQWSPGENAKLHSVFLGTSAELTAADQIAARQPFAMVYVMKGLLPATTYYWRVDEIEADGKTVNTGPVWSLTAQALTAYLPSPANGAGDASTAATLAWQPGQAVVKHHVYFGNSLDAVTQGAASADKGTQEGTTFTPGPLDSVTPYYWRVDEIKADNSVAAGAVWSFTTCLPVDDFESYNDDLDAKTTIFDTWIDGFTNGLSGSTVGNATAPFAEQKIIHGGKQSMPMDYNNVATPFYSEAEREFAPAEDWTVSGLDTLVLYIQGRTANKASSLYVALADSSNKSAVVAYPDTRLVTLARWIEWRIPLSDFAGINLTKVKKMAIGVGQRTGATAGGTGRIYVDDIQVIKAAK